MFGTKVRLLLWTFSIVAAYGLGSGTLFLTAAASHTTYTASSVTFNATTWNGFRVYLSSPTHMDSGGRGELGFDENLNGRHWNSYAAKSSFKNEQPSSLISRSIRARGYNVIVSENSKNDNYAGHVNEGNNWGADVYITTHTNGGGGNYFLTLVDKQTSGPLDDLLQDNLHTKVGGRVPGPEVQSTDATSYTKYWNLYELGSNNNAPYNVYVELIFHDTQNHVDWLGSGSNWIEVTNNSYRYGYAIDLTLGYP